MSTENHISFGSFFGIGSNSTTVPYTSVGLNDYILNGFQHIQLGVDNNQRLSQAIQFSDLQVVCQVRMNQLGSTRMIVGMVTDPTLARLTSVSSVAAYLESTTTGIFEEPAYGQIAGFYYPLPLRDDNAYTIFHDISLGENSFSDTTSSPYSSSGDGAGHWSVPCLRCYDIFNIPVSGSIFIYFVSQTSSAISGTIRLYYRNHSGLDFEE